MRGSAGDTRNFTVALALNYWVRGPRCSSHWGLEILATTFSIWSSKALIICGLGISASIFLTWGLALSFTSSHPECSGSLQKRVGACMVGKMPCQKFFSLHLFILSYNIKPCTYRIPFHMFILLQNKSSFKIVL